MFSPDATLRSTLSTRNPRRRHRTTSTDSFATRQSNKRRKRSSLAPDTFEPLNPTKVNGHTGYANGDAVEPTPDPHSLRDVSVEPASLAVRTRGSKRGDKRGRREDGVVQV